jgi:hypothetical protein
MAFGKFKRITYACSDPQGLLVVGCRVNEVSQCAKIYLDDLCETGSALIDMDRNLMVKGDVEISSNDLRKIVLAIRGEEVPFEEKIEDAILAHFLNQ